MYCACLALFDHRTAFHIRDMPKLGDLVAGKVRSPSAPRPQQSLRWYRRLAVLLQCEVGHYLLTLSHDLRRHIPINKDNIIFTILNNRIFKHQNLFECTLFYYKNHGS